MKNGGWLDKHDIAQEGETLSSPPKSQYKRLYGHAKEFGVGENENMRIDPNTGYSYFPIELSTNQQKEVPDSPWNTSRFLLDPFIRNVSQGIHNAKYNNKGEYIDSPGDVIEQGYLASGMNRRERYDAAKNDITNYYKEDLKLNEDDVEKNVDNKMDLIRKMRRTEEMMQRQNETYKNFQNPEEVFKRAVGFYGDDNEINPSEAKRAYKMFQKTWKGTSGKEARQNSREELRKAQEAFKLSKEQMKEGLPKPDPNYIPEDFANGGILKNGGWLDNYNDSKASAPEGMVGDGYSNVGRNYSPAWGGQFQMGGSVYPVNYVPQAAMGGSIPGAVGFTYARTQSPAPSNGKYAKKTMASAQNGKEMQYYQNGLDYQPKTISQNGSWLDKWEDEHSSVRSIQNDSMNRKIQESKGRGKETTITQKDNTRTVTPKIDTTKPLTKEQVEARRLKEELKQHIASDEETALQERKDQVFKSMQEAYKSPLMSPGYFTPEGAAIGALQGAFKMPGHIAEGDYKGAAIDALMALPIGIPAAKKLLPKFIPKQNYTLPEIESELNLNVNQPRFNQVRSAPRVKKKLVNRWEDKQLDNGLIEQTPLRKGINEDVVKKVTVPNKGDVTLKTSTDATGNPTYYFSANVPEGGLSAGKAYKHLEQFIPKGSKILEKKSLSTDSFYNVMQRAKNPKQFTWVDEGNFLPLNNAGKNKLFSNSDKIVPGSTNVKFEDFNEAKKALNEFNSRITIEGMPKAKLSKIVDDFQSVENGPWIKKTTFGIDTPNIGLIKEYKEGGIIKDDRGQWDHPDEPTRISGGNITMKPDPLTGKPLTEPILGIADTGEEQMMYPGEDYNFKGAEYVDEYPKSKRPKKAQNGLRQEQKGLQNLDNLTNFTNYNKPQPGGWLNKYN
jgi:hypothetical protein